MDNVIETKPTDARLVKLLASENDSITIPLNLLVRFSEMMKCMLSGPGNMIESKNLKVQIDPKFNTLHLNFFEKLLFGSKVDRIQIFSTHQSVVFLKEIYEFLDMYGFNDWKSMIAKRIFQLTPLYDLHKLEQFYAKFNE
jgi:hypothetical protein